MRQSQRAERNRALEHALAWGRESSPLNVDRDFVCGRDPVSLASVAWLFGQHDRPWPERPVFGTVRSMTLGGLRRKTDADAWLRRLTASAGGP